MFEIFAVSLYANFWKMIINYGCKVFSNIDWAPDFAEGSSISASRLQLYEKIGSNRGELW